MGLDVGEVGGFFNKADAVNAVDGASEVSALSLGDAVDGGEGSQVLACAGDGGAVDGIVEERVGTGFGASFVDFGLRAVDGEVEGGVEVVVAPDAANGVVVAKEWLLVGEEKQYEDYGDKQGGYLIDSLEVGGQFLEKLAHIYKIICKDTKNF